MKAYDPKAIKTLPQTETKKPSSKLTIGFIDLKKWALWGGIAIGVAAIGYIVYKKMK